MKAKELIELLEKLPEDEEVYVYADEYDLSGDFYPTNAKVKEIINDEGCWIII